MDVKELWQRINSIKPEDIKERLKEVEPKTWVMIGGGIVIFALFWIFAVSPAWFKRPALKKQIAERTSQIGQLKGLNAKKPQLEKQKQEINDLIGGFQKKLFYVEDVDFLLGRISKVAAEAKVDLIASKPLADQEPFPKPYNEKYKKFAYQITIEGSYHRIAEFVSLLESHERHFQIQYLSIAPQSKNAGSHIADIKLIAVSWLTPPPQAK